MPHKPSVRVTIYTCLGQEVGRCNPTASLCRHTNLDDKVENPAASVYISRYPILRPVESWQISVSAHLTSCFGAGGLLDPEG